MRIACNIGVMLEANENSIHPIELKLDRMILFISPLNRLEPDFSISF